MQGGERGIWYAWLGSNQRPSAPEADALIQLSYRRTLQILPKAITYSDSLSISADGLISSCKMERDDILLSPITPALAAGPMDSAPAA
jgi:hypothetical protein